MNPYYYTESGLGNVIIEAEISVNETGNPLITIPAVGYLHKAIAKSLIDQEGALSGTEIRFLRTEMGLTQAELARLLHRDTQTVGRWERHEILLDPTQDIVFRQLAAEELALTITRTAKEQSEQVIPRSVKPPIKLRHTKNPNQPYELTA